MRHSLLINSCLLIALGVFGFSNTSFGAAKTAAASKTATPAAAVAPAATATAAGDKLIALPENGSVEFVATGRPSMLKIRAKGKGPSGTLTVVDHKISGDLSFELETLDSGIETRDRHMKDKYIEVGKFKTATLHLNSMALPFSLKELNAGAKSSYEFPFEGDFEMHGTTKKVTGTVKLENKVDKPISFEATFGTKISDYNINNPSYAGIKILDDVPVTVISQIKR
jgi:polyisoprenoid-binding protein YceI